MVLPTLVSTRTRAPNVFTRPLLTYTLYLLSPLIPISTTTEVFEHTPAESPAKRKLFVVVSSDKGMCGGIHSSVSKATKRTFAEQADTLDPASPIAVIGDKSKSQLARLFPKNIFLAFNQIGRDVPTFADAAGVADLIIKSGVEYDSVAIVHNKFVSALSYESGIVEVETAEALKESRKSSCAPPAGDALTFPAQPASRRTRWRTT